MPKAHKNAVHCISTNDDGSLALSSSIDGSIAFWDLKAFQHSTTRANESAVEAEENANGGDAACLPLPVDTPDSLLIGKLDSILDRSSGTQQKLSEAWKTLLHPTLPFLASVGAGAIVSLHSVPSSSSDESWGQVLTTATLPTSLSNKKDLFGLTLAFHPTSPLLALGTNTGQVLLYTFSPSFQAVRELKLVSVYSDHPAPIRALTFTPSLLVVGSDDRTISVHDVKPIITPSQNSVLGEDGELRTGGTVASLTGHKGWVMDLAALPNAEGVFASVGADRSIKFWDLSSATKNTPVWNGGEVKGIRAFAFQPPSTVASSGGELLGGEVGATATATRFVTASEDGKLRWL